jgi:histidine triad (HIT) family protein
MSAEADCIFCKVVAGEVPAKVVERGGEAIVIEDINPQAPVHVLVIPTTHYPNAPDVPGDVLERMYALARQVAEARGVAESGYRMVFNLGPDAGQTVFHAHLHVLGGRKLSWPPG